MSAIVYSVCMVLGLMLVTVGCALVSIPLGLVVCGIGLIVLTLLTLKIGGKTG